MTRKEAGQLNNKDAIKVLQEKLNEDAYYHRITGRKITDPYYKFNVIKYRLALLYAIKALRDADNAADVFYICDNKSCIKGTIYGAHACEPCIHTRNIRHAANFSKLIDNDGRVLAYFEHAEIDEGGGAHD